MSTLLDLVKQSEEIANKLIELGGELDSDTEALIAMNGLELKQKFDAYGFVIDQLKLRQEYALAKMKEWDALASQCEKALDHLKFRIIQAMQKMEIDEIHGMNYTIRTQPNPPSVDIAIDEEIPEKYKVIETKIKVDKRSILDDMKEGVEVPGARLVRTTRLVTKVSQRKDLKQLT